MIVDCREKCKGKGVTTRMDRIAKGQKQDKQDRFAAGWAG
jgi:hypothetical protein